MTSKILKIEPIKSYGFIVLLRGDKVYAYIDTHPHALRKTRTKCLNLSKSVGGRAAASRTRAGRNTFTRCLFSAASFDSSAFCPV